MISFLLITEIKIIPTFLSIQGKFRHTAFVNQEKENKLGPLGLDIWIMRSQGSVSTSEYSFALPLKLPTPNKRFIVESPVVTYFWKSLRHPV